MASGFGCALILIVAASARADFAPTGSPLARRTHPLVLLADGHLGACGGQDWCERWDPSTGRWQRTADIADQMRPAAAVRLADGRVLAVEEADGGRPVRWSLADPALSSWTRPRPMPRPLAPVSLLAVAGGALAWETTGACQAPGQRVLLRFHGDRGGWEELAVPDGFCPKAAAAAGDRVAVAGVLARTGELAAAVLRGGRWLGPHALGSRPAAHPQVIAVGERFLVVDPDALQALWMDEDGPGERRRLPERLRGARTLALGDGRTLFALGSRLARGPLAHDAGGAPLRISTAEVWDWRRFAGETVELPFGTLEAAGALLDGRVVGLSTPWPGATRGFAAVWSSAQDGCGHLDAFLADPPPPWPDGVEALALRVERTVSVACRVRIAGGGPPAGTLRRLAARPLDTATDGGPALGRALACLLRLPAAAAALTDGLQRLRSRSVRARCLASLAEQGTEDEAVDRYLMGEGLLPRPEQPPRVNPVVLEALDWSERLASRSGPLLRAARQADAEGTHWLLRRACGSLRPPPDCASRSLAGEKSDFGLVAGTLAGAATLIGLAHAGREAAWGRGLVTATGAAGGAAAGSMGGVWLAATIFPRFGGSCDCALARWGGALAGGLAGGLTSFMATRAGRARTVTTAVALLALAGWSIGYTVVAGNDRGPVD